MPSRLNRIAFALLGLMVATVTRADMAPTLFTGGNVYPIDNDTIRMDRARVLIEWNEPCLLTAEFILTNESEQEVELEIGFPVGAYHSDANGLPNFDDVEVPVEPRVDPVDERSAAITLNGRLLQAYRPIPANVPPEIDYRYASWYLARAHFHPGENHITIRTTLSPSGVSGQPYLRRLSYCIWTGGRWKGPIGREDVEIRFPGVDVTALRPSIQPDFGSVSGDTIRWTFHDLEPTSNAHDIDLVVRHPRVAEKLAELRAAHEAAPTDPGPALKYAVHLFCLGAAKGNAGFPPMSLSPDQFEEVIARLPNPANREIVQGFYRDDGNGSFVAITTEWTPARENLARILGDSGFSKPYPGSDNVAEGRRIVEDCLQRDPTNADAWFTYLTHFWRFSFAARGHPFGPTEFTRPLRAAIEQAFTHCPDDPRLQEWHEAMLTNGPAPGVFHTERKLTPEAWKNEFLIN